MIKKKRKIGTNNARRFVIHINVESLGDFPAVEARLIVSREMVCYLMESFDRVTGTTIVEHLKI